MTIFQSTSMNYEEQISSLYLELICKSISYVSLFTACTATPYINLTFNDDDVSKEVANISRQGGKGIFNGNTVVELYRLANNYDNKFAVQITLQPNTSQNMMIMRNCDSEETLSMSLANIDASTVSVTAKLRTASGTLQLPPRVRSICEINFSTLHCRCDYHYYIVAHKDTCFIPNPL